ncbi:MAG: DUF2252 family protein [Streptosporangiaceae bacterium]
MRWDRGSSICSPCNDLQPRAPGENAGPRSRAEERDNATSEIDGRHRDGTVGQLSRTDRVAQGLTLARAHARSGDRIALAAYLGGSAKFDQAIADFAETYADQNEPDYAALQAAVKDGRVVGTSEI